MALSKKRKVDTEKWTEKYLFTEVNAKPVCLVCYQQVAVFKEFNSRRHYETHHKDKYDHLKGQIRKDETNKLVAGLKKQQASYIIANELVQASKPFSDGEFVKTCMLKAAEVVCLEKRPAFANITKSKIKSFIAFSIAIDESTDVTDTAQLATFIRGVDETLTITAELLGLVGADWSHAVSLATDGAPSMVGRKAGVASKFSEKVQTANGGQEFWAFHCILHQEALLKELKCKGWVQDLAFMVDITQHVNRLNTTLQGCNRMKLSLWRTQLSNGDTVHFSCLTAVCLKAQDRPDNDLDKYKDNITDLLREFEQRFQPSDMPADIQLELIDLQCDSAIKDKFGSVGLDTFYQYLVPGYPKLTAMAAKVLSMFGTTYLCEKVFSVMNNNKTKQSSKLTNKHLNDIVNCAATQDFTLNIDALVKAKRCQVSGASSSK
ncbi:hypothetical protein Q5P01_010544 [Channa striata]|uniref:SPIN-DOC-like zinc-finger domain-containing protein n=1 Tax=Channa striata TaxID=64152 RepID=A0AA88N4V6_CHASR|nr:hypothetical protein Q5P01_010544 [Channa striata]